MHVMQDTNHPSPLNVQIKTSTNHIALWPAINSVSVHQQPPEMLLSRQKPAMIEAGTWIRPVHMWNCKTRHSSQAGAQHDWVIDTTPDWLIRRTYNHEGVRQHTRNTHTWDIWMYVNRLTCTHTHTNASKPTPHKSDQDESNSQALLTQTTNMSASSNPRAKNKQRYWLTTCLQYAALLKCALLMHWE